jgi:LacI family transcriptional regulator
MEDIAVRAGVNRATVSNVLNGRFQARRSDAVRRADRIRKIAHEMGYRFNVAARSTRTGTTGLIGLIRSPLLSHSVHAPEFESGVDEALHRRGLCLVRDLIDQAVENDDAEDATRVPRIVREKVVDGLLVNYAFGTPPAVRRLLDRCQIPALWINRKRDANCVHPADEGAAFDATRHLIGLGHTDIGFVVAGHEALGGYEPHYSTIDRVAGYRRAMLAAGLRPRILETDKPGDLRDKVGHGLREAQKLLAMPDRPTALVCERDGHNVLHAAALAGVRVPRELSLITFDNVAASGQHIPIDRMLVRYKALGVLAVEELLHLMNDEAPEPRRPVAVPFEFHLTGTTTRR